MSDFRARRWKWRLVGMVIGCAIVMAVFSARSHFNFDDSMRHTSSAEVSSNIDTNEGSTSGALENSDIDVQTAPAESSIDADRQDKQQQILDINSAETANEETAERVATGNQTDGSPDVFDSSVGVSSEDLLADESDVEGPEFALQWSKVWRAFRSERTANGFADYISDSTGLTLRVSSLADKGEYYVEVSHSTKAEHRAAIERIVQATGYRPPEPELQ